MKGLPKSLRERQRYVWFELELDPWIELGEEELQRQVWWEAQNLYGDLVSSEAELQLVEFEGSVGVLRVAHDKVGEARAALACVHDVKGVPVGVHVVGVSGTLKSGRKKYLRSTEVEETMVDGMEAWRRGKRLDLKPGKQNKYEGGRPTGATIYDVGSGVVEPREE